MVPPDKHKALLCTGTFVRDKELDPVVSYFNSATCICVRAISLESTVGGGTFIALVAILDNRIITTTYVGNVSSKLRFPIQMTNLTWISSN